MTPRNPTPLSRPSRKQLERDHAELMEAHAQLVAEMDGARELASSGAERERRMSEALERARGESSLLRSERDARAQERDAARADLATVVAQRDEARLNAAGEFGRVKALKEENAALRSQLDALEAQAGATKRTLRLLWDDACRVYSPERAPSLNLATHVVRAVEDTLKSERTESRHATTCTPSG